MAKLWEGIIQAPLQGRKTKPRKEGITMVIDKGIGLQGIKDLIQIAGDYIDIIKLAFGTSAFYNLNLLKEKNEIITSSRIDAMPGGTFLEVAVWQRSFEQYLRKSKELGFSALEISDGTIDLDKTTRADIIKKSIDAGFRVITEVGKKDPAEALPISLMHQLIGLDMENGAFKVIIEAREAGKGVGIYDQDGKIKEEEIDNIIAGVKDLNCLIWEAPLKYQQQALILRFGPNINLGNIAQEEVLTLEALRQGLRGDTLKKVYLARKDWRR